MRRLTKCARCLEQSGGRGCGWRPGSLPPPRAPPTICLCQNHLLCNERGMKSIQAPPPPSCFDSKWRRELPGRAALANSDTRRRTIWTPAPSSGFGKEWDGWNWLWVRVGLVLDSAVPGDLLHCLKEKLHLEPRPAAPLPRRARAKAFSPLCCGIGFACSRQTRRTKAAAGSVAPPCTWGACTFPRGPRHANCQVH